MLAQLVQAYQHFNLPTTLAALEVDINNRAELDRVIAHTLRPGESIHYLPVTLTLRFCARRLRRWNTSAVNHPDRLYLMMMLTTRNEVIMQIDLTGKKALVTGASRGWVAPSRRARAPAHVVITYEKSADKARRSPMK
ncbi:putative oxidoreductase YbdH [Klebsiella pneumoniae]|nr:putative oxidoreductase YbdH [Klebsiella pneumoniae]